MFGLKVAEYIVQFLYDHGIDTVFMVTGGGSIHLDEAVRAHGKMNAVFNHHEQACAFAAEGYARMKGIPGAIIVTTGPGSTNAITGVTSAWLDSIPMIVISGQVKRGYIKP